MICWQTWVGFSRLQTDAMLIDVVAGLTYLILLGISNYDKRGNRGTGYRELACSQ